jgi:hypothetical protein
MSARKDLEFKDFLDWIKKSKRGDSIVYFKGKSLESPRAVNDGNGQIEVVWIKADIGLAAWVAYEKGLVALTQRKKSNRIINNYDYIATRL